MFVETAVAAIEADWLLSHRARTFNGSVVPSFLNQEKPRVEVQKIQWFYNFQWFYNVLHSHTNDKVWLNDCWIGIMDYSSVSLLSYYIMIIAIL